MSYASDHVARLREVVTQLDPVALNARIADHIRGGLPTVSGGSGLGRGGERPDPAFDSTDRRAGPDWIAYETALARARTALEGALRTQNGYLAGRSLRTVDDTTPPADDDACPSCARTGHYQPRDAARRLCSWCDTWQRNHDGQWPPTEILDAHHRGIRITTSLVERVMRATVAAKPRKRKRRA